MQRPLLSASILVLALSIAYASAPEAIAQQAPPGAVCKLFRGANQKSLGAMASWMDDQIATGRDDLVVSQVDINGRIVCAW